MIRRSLFPLLVIYFFSCNQDKDIDRVEKSELTQIIAQEYDPLSENPLLWSDEELQFLDELSNKEVIGLGESTHGTAEFFNAKARILRYMAENHGFRTFAMEADFGESVFINEAIQNSDKAAIRELMLDKMHFWTWRTQEVESMLEWMCDFNEGKADDEKLQYVGIDCQFNTYNPILVRDYLESADIPFMNFAAEVLGNFEHYTEIGTANGTSDFENYKSDVKALQDSITKYKNELISSSSEMAYKMNSRMLEVARQVLDVKHGNTDEVGYRDQYMAENVAWLADEFGDNKIVLWAHNFHVANVHWFTTTGSIGHHLKENLDVDYSIIGFFFSTGEFRDNKGIKSINTSPKEGSINLWMQQTEQPTFHLKVPRLIDYEPWFEAFHHEILQISIGAVFNSDSYYAPWVYHYYDHMIYIDNTHASILIQ